MPYETLSHAISGPDQAPALLMGGSLGTTFAMWERQLPLAGRMRLIAERVPDCRLETVSPAAHLAAVEQAEAVNRLILEHLS